MSTQVMICLPITNEGLLVKRLIQLNGKRLYYWSEVATWPSYPLHLHVQADGCLTKLFVAMKTKTDQFIFNLKYAEPDRNQDQKVHLQAIKCYCTVGTVGYILYSFVKYIVQKLLTSLLSKSVRARRLESLYILIILLSECYVRGVRAETASVVTLR